MAVPAGLDVPTGSRANYVRLRKAVYELKQAPREWHHTFVEFLRDLGFCQLYSDIYVFVHGHGDDVIIISVHVDDTNILSPSIKKIEWLKKIVDAEYGSMTLVQLHFFLVLNWYETKSTKLWRYTHQQRYIQKF